MRSFRHFQSLFSEIFRNFANQWTVANCKIYSKTEKYMYLCILKYIKPNKTKLKYKPEESISPDREIGFSFENSQMVDELLQ